MQELKALFVASVHGVEFKGLREIDKRAKCI
jgi:hypothetical protein